MDAHDDREEAETQDDSDTDRPIKAEAGVE